MEENQARTLVRLLPILIAVGVIGFTVVRGCQTGPFGRKQIVALTPEQEAQLGGQAFREVLSKEAGNVVGGGPVEPSRKAEMERGNPVVFAVWSVANRLVDATSNHEVLKLTRQKYQKMDWDVRVVRSRQINAFCLPGGKIVVYTAILPICENNAGLAAVMGHEIAHALAHHGAERMAQQKIAQIGLAAAGASLGDMSPEQRQRVLMALNAGAQFGILSYSRSHESEADKMGLLLMAAAGYDPEEAARFWQRMAARSSGSRTPEFMSTHPSHQTRIRDLDNWQKLAEPLYQEALKRKGPPPPTKKKLPPVS